MTAAHPPMSSQTDLSVGVPVKKREMSELKESIAVIPKTMRITPPTINTNDINLFMIVLSGLRPWRSLPMP
jgi:ABC-type molybdenum transport system ATPase subunit/photorepair protein PhrA